MKRRSTTFRLALALALLVGAAAGLRAQIKIHTGFPKGSYYEMASDIEDIVNVSGRMRVELDTQYTRRGLQQGQKVLAENFEYEAKIIKDTIMLGDLVKVVPSRGSIENFDRLVRQRESFTPTLGFIQYDVLISKQLQDMRNRTNFTSNFRVILPVGQEYVHLITRQNEKGINTLADLKKKKVAIGRPEAGTNYTAKLIKETLGLEWENVELPVDVALSQLLAGEIDALFYVSAAPVSYFDTRALRTELKMIPIDDPALNDYYDMVTVSADTYPWLSEPVKTVAVQGLLVSANNTSDPAGTADLEELLTAIKDNIDTLRSKGHPNWKKADFDFESVDWEIHRLAKKILEN